MKILINLKYILIEQGPIAKLLGKQSCLGRTLNTFTSSHRPGDGESPKEF